MIGQTEEGEYGKKTQYMIILTNDKVCEFARYSSPVISFTSSARRSCLSGYTATTVSRSFHRLSPSSVAGRGVRL